MKSCTRRIIRINQLRIINSKLSLRRSEADAGASLKFIILSVTYLCWMWYTDTGFKQNNKVSQYNFRRNQCITRLEIP